MIEQFLQEKHDWDIFYLGGLVQRVDNAQTNRDVYQVQSSTTHAYFMSRKCIERLSHMENFSPFNYERLPIDHFYRLNCDTWILRQPICFQRNSPSDNIWSETFTNKLIQTVLQKYGWELFYTLNNLCMRTLREHNWLNPFYFLYGLPILRNYIE